MRISVKPAAEKQFSKLPASEKKKIIRKLHLLATDPQAGKSLKGELEGLRSLRAWPYRIIYAIHDNEIMVYSIAHRQGVYTS